MRPCRARREPHRFGVAYMSHTLPTMTLHDAESDRSKDSSTDLELGGPVAKDVCIMATLLAFIFAHEVCGIWDSHGDFDLRGE